MRVQHINHALNPGKCFIFTDFVQCTYFELQQGNGVTAKTANVMAAPSEIETLNFIVVLKILADISD